MAKVSRKDFDEARGQLREWIRPGDTVYTILEHVSRSGMQRTIRIVVPYVRPTCGTCGHYDDSVTLGARCVAPRCEGRYTRGAVDHLHPNYSAAMVTGYPLDKGRGRDGIKIGGCGMDMGFQLVHQLSTRLYGGERCDCGGWEDDAQPGQRFTQEKYMQRDSGGRVSDGWHYRYDPHCPRCKGSGSVIGTGYQCLGKGRCPSNYHSNHRDHIGCPGVVRPECGEDGQYVRCAKPSPWGRFKEEIPEDWPTGAAGELLTTLFTPEGDYGREVCPACEGRGSLPNPDGPERFDLEHFDGYAVRHRWL